MFDVKPNTILILHEKNGSPDLVSLRSVHEDEQFALAQINEDLSPLCSLADQLSGITTLNTDHGQYFFTFGVLMETEFTYRSIMGPIQ